MWRALPRPRAQRPGTAPPSPAPRPRLIAPSGCGRPESGTPPGSATATGQESAESAAPPVAVQGRREPLTDERLDLIRARGVEEGLELLAHRLLAQRPLDALHPQHQEQ